MNTMIREHEMEKGTRPRAGEGPAEKGNSDSMRMEAAGTSAARGAAGADENRVLFKEPGPVQRPAAPPRLVGTREQADRDQQQGQTKKTNTTRTRPGYQTLEEHLPPYTWRRKETVDCITWLVRERAKGLPTSPEAEEFREINEYIAAKNTWREETEKRRQDAAATNNSKARDHTTARAEREEGEPEDVLMLDVSGEMTGQVDQPLEQRVDGRGNRGAAQGGTTEVTSGGQQPNQRRIRPGRGGRRESRGGGQFVLTLAKWGQGRPCMDDGEFSKGPEPRERHQRIVGGSNWQLGASRSVIGSA